MLIPLGVLAVAGAGSGAITNWSEKTVTDLTYKEALYAPLANATWYGFANSNAGGNTTSYIYSTDGDTWSTGTMPADKAWGVAATDGTRIIVFEFNASDTVIATTTNGTTWTTASIATITAQDVIWDGSYFVVTNSGSTTNTIYYSADGITSWTAVDSGNAALRIGYDGSSRHILTQTGANSSARTTTTGVTSAGNWSNVTLPASDTWEQVLYGGGYWVIVATAGNIAYSTNGTTWTAASPTGSDRPNWTYGNGNFYWFRRNSANSNFQIRYTPNPTVSSTLVEVAGAATDSPVASAFGDNKIIVVTGTTSSSTELWLGT